jgi:hypothetical protein
LSGLSLIIWAGAQTSGKRPDSIPANGSPESTRLASSTPSALTSAGSATVDSRCSERALRDDLPAASASLGMDSG